MIEDEYELIMKLINMSVMNARKKITDQFGTTDLTGLCDQTCFELEKIFEAEMRKFTIKTPYKFDIVHGELKHTPRIKSKFWHCEHTWCVIKFYELKKTIYVDPTSSQFQDLFPEIPSSYISTRKPKWYYEDSRNPLWWRPIYDTPFQKIFGFFQYTVWGHISDFIHYTVNHMH